MIGFGYLSIAPDNRRVILSTKRAVGVVMMHGPNWEDLRDKPAPRTSFLREPDCRSEMRSPFYLSMKGRGTMGA